MRLVILLVLSGCWRSSPPPPPIPSNTVTEPKPAEAPLSPGIVMVNGASKTFHRGVRLAEKGDHYSALIELYKVISGDTGDNDSVKDAASYNLGTVCLELGYYTHSFYYYSRLIQRSRSSDLAGRLATGLAVIFDRLGTKTELPLAKHVQMLGPNIVERAQPHVRHHVKRLATVTAPPGGVAGIESDLARVDHELKILQESDRAFQTTMVAAEILQELVVHQSLLDAECSKHRCNRSPWVAPPLARSPTATSESSR